MNSIISNKLILLHIKSLKMDHTSDNSQSLKMFEIYKVSDEEYEKIVHDRVENVKNAHNYFMEIIEDKSLVSDIVNRCEIPKIGSHRNAVIYFSVKIINKNLTNLIPEVDMVLTIGYTSEGHYTGITSPLIQTVLENCWGRISNEYLEYDDNNLNLFETPEDAYAEYMFLENVEFEEGVKLFIDNESGGTRIITVKNGKYVNDPKHDGTVY